MVKTFRFVLVCIGVYAEGILFRVAPFDLMAQRDGPSPWSRQVLVGLAPLANHNLPPTPQHMHMPRVREYVWVSIV